MRMRPPRRALVLLLPVLLLATSSLTACQLLGGDDDTLADALDLVPATVTEAEFVNRSALAERLGLDDLTTPADAAGVRKYRRATDLYLAPPSGLHPYLETMQAVAFSELDVEWAVHAPVPGGRGFGPTDIYKVADDVDLDEVVTDLVRAGFDHEEVDGRSQLESKAVQTGTDDVGYIGEGYPDEFAYGLIVAPEEHLVITTSAFDSVTAVLDDEADSLADAGTFDAVVDDVDDVEYAFLQRDVGCGGHSKEQLELGVADLGDVTRRGLLASTDDDTVALSARLQFDDDDAAEDDLEARTEYFDTGRSTSTGDPVSDLGQAELDRDGDVVMIELDLEPSYHVLEMMLGYDAYFACNA